MRQLSRAKEQLCLFVMIILIMTAWEQSANGSAPNRRKTSEKQQPVDITSKLVDPQKGVAIAGAWQRVEAALANIVANRPAQARYTIPKRSSQRFLGFIEGLLRVSLPTSFSRNIDHAQVIWNGHVRFPIQDYSAWNREQRKLGEMPVEIPALNVSVENEKVIVRVATGNFPSTGEDGVITLSSGLSKSVLNDDGIVLISSAIFAKGRIYLAVVDKDYPGGKVHCLSSSGDKIHWSKQFMDYAGPSYSGSGDWFTEMRVAENQLFMFHCCESSFGIEGLSLDGESQFVFTSIDGQESSGNQK